MEKVTSDVSKNVRSAIWDHYYNGEEKTSDPKKKIRRITKKEIIVRTLKKKAPQGESISLQNLSEMTGLSPHDLSGHLTHLVNEGKVDRKGRGLFAPAESVSEQSNSRQRIRSLVEDAVKSSGKGRQINEKIVIRDRDHSENRRMLLDYLNDMLLSCSEVEVSIKCTKDEDKGTGKMRIELRAQ